MASDEAVVFWRNRNGLCAVDGCPNGIPDLQGGQIGGVTEYDADDFGVIRVGWTAQLCREHFALCSSGTDGLSLTARTSLT